LKLKTSQTNIFTPPSGKRRTEKTDRIPPFLLVRNPNRFRSIPSSELNKRDIVFLLRKEMMVCLIRKKVKYEF